MGMNNFIEVKGNLGADIQLRKTQTGKSVGTFNIGVQRMKDANGNAETDWFKCVVWDKVADYLAKTIGKGDAIRVRGTIENHPYDDKNTGRKTDSWQINVQEFDFSKKQPKQENSYYANYEREPEQSDPFDITADDLPF